MITLMQLIAALQITLLVASIHATIPRPWAKIEDIVRRAQAEVFKNTRVFADISDAYLDTPELGRKYGYPVETHKVTTEDGYILTVHRIPHGKKTAPAPAGGRPVVWLQHGLLCSSSDWLYQNKDQPLGYRLADAGYDVWLGNARGNYYSKEHVSLDTNSSAFWSFSWHEMGKYDLPASFDYVRNVTGKPDLYYIGHSMGTTMFFVCMAIRPEYNSRIRLMSALAPVAYTEHMKSPLAQVAPFSRQVDQIANLFGVRELLPTSPVLDFLRAKACNQTSPVHILCENIMFLICGYDSPELNKTMLPVITGHVPAGSSVRSAVHYAQGVTSGEFRFFDFGKWENLRRYGLSIPSVYNLSKITAPVALYWGENDWLADKADVNRLAEELPNLQRKYKVPFHKFNHLDFLWAIDAVPLLYQPMEKFMASF